MTTLHIARCSLISRNQKTATTECGKKVSAKLIATDTDADCPGCRSAVEASIRGAEMILAHAKAMPGMEANVTEIEATLPDWRATMYRTMVFL